MNRTMRAALAARADSLGFDSAQALLRYMAKAAVDKRAVTFGEDPWGEPSPRAAARLQRLSREAREQSARGELKDYTSVKELMKDLMNEAN